MYIKFDQKYENYGYYCEMFYESANQLKSKQQVLKNQSGGSRGVFRTLSNI